MEWFIPLPSIPLPTHLLELRAVLYGVTMEEHGVSKIVSVKFDKADEPATRTATASLETPMANPVDKEEDAPHKREETLEITLAK